MDRQGIAAVILSAGNSSRMGCFKPLLRFGSRTLIERTVALFRESGIDDIRVVTGHGREMLNPILQAAGASTLVNPHDSAEMFSSVRTALRSMGPEVNAVILLPGDFPLIRPYTVRTLLRVRQQHPQSILIPSFRNKRGHPVVLPAEHFEAIQNWNGLFGLKGALSPLSHKLLPVPVADENILFDIDTPEDYEQGLKRWECSAVPSREECKAILLDVVRVTPALYAHCRAVAVVAARICDALARAGCPTDRDTVTAAALLHDLAKGEPRHERRASELLAEMGFPEIARIVASHTDIECSEAVLPTSAEILYLADKKIKGDRIVDLPRRFEDAQKRFNGDCRILAKIRKRMNDAYFIQEKIETVIGRPLRFE